MSNQHSKKLSVMLFAGGPAGLAALRGLALAGHRIAGCFADPAGPSANSADPIRAECVRLGVPCSADTTSGEISPSLADRPDVVLAVGYSRRVEMPFLALGTVGGFNVAFSQLPRYRGCFPFRWAILNSESAWGVTVHQMTGRFCDGAVLHRRGVAVRPGENAYDFYLRCSAAAAAAAVDAVDMLASNDFRLASCEPAGAPLFGAAAPFGGAIDWAQPAGRIEAFVRALDFGRHAGGSYEHLAPPASAVIGGERVGIWRAGFGGTMSVYPPGTLTRRDDQVWVQAGRGHVVIERVFAGGADHLASEWFARRGLSAGDAFDVSHDWRHYAPTGEPSRGLSYAA